MFVELLAFVAIAYLLLYAVNVQPLLRRLEQQMRDEFRHIREAPSRITNPVGGNSRCRCTDGWNQQDATRFAGDHAACSCAESLAAREQQQGASGAAREPQQGTRLAVRDCPWITTPRPVQETNRYASYALTMAPRRQGEGINIAAVHVQETNTRRFAFSDFAMAPRRQDEATTPVQETNRDASSDLAMAPRKKQ